MTWDPYIKPAKSEAQAAYPSLVFDLVDLV
jgi:hypothetical protein